MTHDAEVETVGAYSITDEQIKNCLTMYLDTKYQYFNLIDLIIYNTIYFPGNVQVFKCVHNVQINAMLLERQRPTYVYIFSLT